MPGEILDTCSGESGEEEMWTIEEDCLEQVKSSFSTKEMELSKRDASEVKAMAVGEIPSPGCVSHIGLVQRKEISKLAFFSRLTWFWREEVNPEPPGRFWRPHHP